MIGTRNGYRGLFVVSVLLFHDFMYSKRITVAIVSSSTCFIIFMYSKRITVVLSVVVVMEIVKRINRAPCTDTCTRDT